MPSAAAWTTRPRVAVHDAFGFDMTNEPDESRTERRYRRMFARHRTENILLWLPCEWTNLEPQLSIISMNTKPRINVTPREKDALFENALFFRLVSPMAEWVVSACLCVESESNSLGRSAVCSWAGGRTSSLRTLSARTCRTALSFTSWSMWLRCRPTILWSLWDSCCVCNWLVSNSLKYNAWTPSGMITASAVPTRRPAPKTVT